MPGLRQGVSGGMVEREEYRVAEARRGAGVRTRRVAGQVMAMWIAHALFSFVVLSLGLSMVSHRPPSERR